MSGNISPTRGWRTMRFIAMLAAVFVVPTLSLRADHDPGGVPLNKIAFERGDNIWVIDTTTGVERQVTFLGNSGAPTWAPNRRAIAFVDRQRGNWNLWVINVTYDASGSLSPVGSPVQLTTGGALGPEWGPATAPNGHPYPYGRIAYFANRTGNDEVWLAEPRIQGGLVTGTLSDLRLTEQPGFTGWPTWSPDGSQIAMAGAKANGTIRLHTVQVPEPVALRVPTVVTTQAGGDIPAINFEWSPLQSNNTSQIAWGAGDVAAITIFHGAPGPPPFPLTAANTSAPALLTTSPALDAFPTWSPDGTKLAFHSDRPTSGRGNGTRQVYLMLDPATGEAGGLQQLTLPRDGAARPAWHK